MFEISKPSARTPAKIRISVGSLNTPLPYTTGETVLSRASCKSSVVEAKVDFELRKTRLVASTTAGGVLVARVKFIQPRRMPGFTFKSADLEAIHEDFRDGL